MFRVIFYIELHTLGSEAWEELVPTDLHTPQILIFVAMLMPILLLNTPAAPTHTCTNMHTCLALTVPKNWKRKFPEICFFFST